MKTHTLSPEDQAAVDALRAEIRQRPGYHLVQVWAERNRLGENRTPIPTAIDRITYAIERALGAKLEGVTVMVALEDMGLPVVRLGRHRGEPYGEVSIDERVILDIAEQGYRGELPPPGRLRIWGDDDAAGSVQ